MVRALRPAGPRDPSIAPVMQIIWQVGGWQVSNSIVHDCTAVSLTCHLEHPSRCEEQVLWLDVAVDDVFAVDVLQSRDEGKKYL
jgi:hypothetical protein